MDLVIVRKIEQFQRCQRRIFLKISEDIVHDQDIQDIVMLNLQRACQNVIDIGAIIIRNYKLGTIDSTKGAFDRLADHDLIDRKLAKQLIKMTRFRNIAIHDYSKIDYAEVKKIIEDNFQDFETFIDIIRKTEQTNK